MDEKQFALILRAIAIIGAIVVGIVAIYQVRNDWKTPGLDIQVSKLLLAIMAVGCIIVILSSTGVIGWQAKGGY
jgi:hypothetical protein